MRFSTCFISRFSVEHNGFMIALSPDKDSIANIKKFQEKLSLKDPIKPDILHLTLRYFKGFDEGGKIINLLKDYKLPKSLKCKVDRTSILGEDKTLVILLQSSPLMTFQSNLDKELLSLGVPKSTYNNFKPHVSLSYSYDEKTMDFPDFKYINFDEIKFVHSDEVLWSKKL